MGRRADFFFKIYIFSTCKYSQTSLIRSSFIRIPRHPDENSWLHIYRILDASNINGVQLSGSLAYPDIFVENRCVRLCEV